MYKQLFFLMLFNILFSNIKAQKGNNALSLHGEISIPFFQNDPGFGLFAKGLYGIGKSAQLTLAGGVAKFDSKNSIGAEKTTTRLIPFLFGYKRNFGKFFVEPRIGFGELGGKILINGDYSRPSIAAIFAGLGTGYKLNRINIGIQFLGAQGIENSSAGIGYNNNFTYTSVSIGYELF